MSERRKTVYDVLCLVLCIYLVAVIGLCPAAGSEAATGTEGALPAEPDAAAFPDRATDPAGAKVDNDEGPAEGEPVEEESTPLVPAVPDLSGIWSITLDGSEQVTMALNQFEDRLFGSCNSESSYNAVLMGTVTGDSLEIAATYITQGTPVAVTLRGNLTDGNIQGNFFRQDAMGLYESGPFTGILIHPDPATYVPTEVAGENATLTTPSIGNDLYPGLTGPALTADGSTDKISTAGGQNEKGYTDVHDLAHLVPPAAGVIPPGMGSFGGGGASMAG